MTKYSNSTKKEMCIKVCVNKESTIVGANNVSVKSLQTSYTIWAL